MKYGLRPRRCGEALASDRAQYVQVNTIFNVARDAGMRTAWSDKHPANQVLSGPSGNGVQDYFTPEINSTAIGYTTGDWTTDNAATMQYDSYKVQAVVNWIRGFDHSGRHFRGTPAIFGMNFQTVSTAQKLPASDGLIGGYQPGGTVPGPLLIRALNYINTSIGKMVTAIKQRGIANSTAIIISAKHGQSPTNPNDLARVPDSAILSTINAAWATTHPQQPQPRHLLRRRRQDAAVAERPLADRGELREELPADPLRVREQHQRPADHGLVVRAQEGLRGRPVRGVLRRPERRSPAPRRSRHRPARRRLYRRHVQDRRARR
jgi:Type I phosphodiesterase / nucleotide pyrophosphatase